MEGDTFLSAAERAVDAALAAAPDYPETQLAAAVLSSQRADYSAAVLLLRRAVTIAPTFGEAHEYLGLLQMEAGRTKEGIERLELAMSLDPLGPLGVSLLWRHYVFHGDIDKRDQMFEELARRCNEGAPVMYTTRLRSALWQRDTRALEELTKTRAGGTLLSSRMLVAVARVGAGRGTAEDEAALDTLPDRFAQPRFSALGHQYAAEAWSVIGRPERALVHIAQAAAGGLLDLEWLLHCPALESVRSDVSFDDAVRRVRERARALWIA
jgi:serine/threonine-protein kinase